MTERRVLVTGAGSGIGMATVRHLASLGFTTVGLVPDERERTALAAAARGWGADVDVVVADLSVAGAAAVADGLQLYAVVNNAGYMNVGLPQDVGLDEARRQFEAMVFAPMDLALRALPGMLRRGEGKIVNVTSAAAHAATPFTGWYVASKAALRGLTDSLRTALAGTGVDVVDVEPGGVDTRTWARAHQDLLGRRAASAQPGAYDRALAATAVLRSGMTPPERVAGAIGRALTTARPRAHVRVGRGATALRVVSEAVPDRVSDWASARIAGAG
jgi:short-subunit dehydrogenase